MDLSSHPIVSVIIPSFNRAEYLGPAIESVLAQTYPNLEVIVVDDGSKDNSVEVAQSFGERVQVIERENGGVSAARNSGIFASEGKYIALLDGDDRMLPDCIEARVKVLEADPELGACLGSYVMTRPDGSPTGDKDIRDTRPQGDPFRCAVRSNWGATCGIVYRRSAIDTCGAFDPIMRGCEDWDILVRIAARHRFHYDPTPRAEYRMVEGSISKSLIPMYDAAELLMRKNRPLARSRWSYFVDSLIGLNTHCTGVVFSRYKNGLLGPRGGRMVAMLALRRPKVLFFGMLWALRAVRNRILWVFGMGPLRRKPA